MKRSKQQIFCCFFLYGKKGEDTVNEKEILRKSILNALKTMTDDELEQRAEPLYERFMQQPIIQDAKTVALTISMAHELPTRHSSRSSGRCQKRSSYRGSRALKQDRWIFTYFHPLKT
nr:5-formyltetrahydrofolate cyclo-ligase [Geomicrobium sp. JCM 19055]